MKSNSVLYDTIGTAYNITRRADPFIYGKIFELLSPQTNDKYIDIGCGTGNYTIALADMGLSFYGVEPSEKMLQIAKSKSVAINWLLAMAEQLPVNDKLFDGAIATLTIHHWAELPMAFGEIYRVLKDDGKLVIFTATPEQMSGYWLNHYFPKMMADAINQMPANEAIETAARQSGFTIIQTEKYFIHPALQDHFLYSGKHDPKLYLDENVRKGISSFAVLANLSEVEKGLGELAGDIDSGKFPNIKHQYDNDKGDYIFIKLKKD